MRRPLLLLLGGLLGPSFVGCSLMNLDDFAERRCHSDDDCAEAQQRFGDAASCNFYVCSDGLCVEQHGVETCNGKDDDCNGIIDDQLDFSPRALTGTSSSDAIFAYATTPSSAYVVAGVDPVQGIVVTGTSVAPPVELAYASEAAPIEEAAGRRCPALSGSVVVANSCTFSDVALAADAEHLVYATINSDGCADGQLRVGLAEHDDPFTVWLGNSPNGSDQLLSQVEGGVDVDAQGCSGASLATNDGKAPGARSPAVASLDTSAGGGGALVAWLAASVKEPARDRCRGALDVGVEALGLFVPQEEPFAVHQQLEGSGAGLPVTIGRTSRLTAPAVVGLPASARSRGYLVAFPSFDDQEQVGVGIFSVSSTSQHLDVKPASFVLEDHADLVVLASDADGKSKKLGLAWLGGGCGKDAALKFATLTLSDTEPGVSLPLSIPVASVSSKPQLLYRPGGLTAGSRPGGWYLSWSETPTRGTGLTRLARISDESVPRIIDVTVVTSGASGFPLLFPSGSIGLNQGLVTAAPDQDPEARVFAGWCQ